MRGRGFDFLGYHFEAANAGPGEEPDEAQGHDPSQDDADIGDSLPKIIASLEPHASRLV